MLSIGVCFSRFRNIARRHALLSFFPRTEKHKSIRDTGKAGFHARIFASTC